MRVADKMTHGQVLRNLQENRSEMSRLHDQASTQKRVTRPSDDPVASSRVLAARSELRGAQQFDKNLSGVQHFLNVTDDALNEVTEIISRAKELAISQSSDPSASKDTRLLVASEVEQLYQQLVKVGNYSFGNKYIFGGYKTTKPPFDQEGNYHGDSGEMLIHVDKDSFIAMNVPGSKLFVGKDLGRDGFAHVTSKQPRSLEELSLQQINEDADHSGPAPADLEVRGPASEKSEGAWEQPDHGVNILQAVKNFEISLKANDKYGVQDALGELDRALNQVIMTRSSVGSRASIIEHSMNTLQKSKYNSQSMISELEDADIFKVVSDINKTESMLKATMQTTSKMIQPSLLDFLR